MFFGEFDPLVREWFEAKFASATEPQLRGWVEIAAGHDTLVCAPTGSGKTLAAFLICLNRLVREAREGTLEDATQVVYVSPLKALSNDVQKNLDKPLAEIRELAARTGDTPMAERQRMGRKPPHVLVTTPESLYSG